MFYIPFDGLVSLYIVSALFGLSQGGIVPTYAIIVRDYFPPQEAATRVGIVMMSTVIGGASSSTATPRDTKKEVALSTVAPSKRVFPARSKTLAPSASRVATRCAPLRATFASPM